MVLLARLQEAKEKVNLSQDTHQQTFKAFEQATLQGEEHFAAWDDYVEWKAYRALKQDLEKKVDALNHGDFEVA